MGSKQIIAVNFKGLEVGKIGFDEHKKVSSFQYNPAFLDSEKYLNLFPYLFKRTKHVQVFANYEGETFRGLPPMIADSLPDVFGNIVFKEWLEFSHKEIGQISPLEQLTYVANRGIGALEYLPAKELLPQHSINIKEITEVVKKVLDFKIAVHEKNLSDVALLNIFKIGTSAGGARPKILISEHKLTGQIIPGDIEFSSDYQHYLIKLCVDDESNYSKEAVEFVYYQLSTSLGIEMMPSKLIDKKHFATLRFDRVNGEKRHVLTASGMTGWDFKKANNSSYENLFKLAVDLKLSHQELQQLFKRMVFNVVFANIDDHLKNFSFLYDDDKDRWHLAPAYDLTYPLDPMKNYLRTSRALSINGKRNDISKSDLLQIAELFTIKQAQKIITEISNAKNLFGKYASALEIPENVIRNIEKEFCSFE